MRTWLKAGAVIVGLYGLTVNGLINSPFLKRQLSTWRDGDVQYRWALMGWPGQVTVFGAVLRFQDRNVQFTAVFDRVSLRLSFTRLFRHELQIATARASGAEFRLRMRRAEDLERKVRDGVLPPFEPFHREPKPKLGKESELKLVSFPYVSVSRFREIWIGEYRYRGDAEVRGGFRFSPGKWAEVGRSTLRLAGGEIRLGQERVADGLGGEIEAAIAKFPADISTADFLTSVDADVHLDMPKVDLRFFNYYLADSPWLRIARGEGPLHARLKLRQGRLTSPSRVTTPDTTLGVRVGELLLRGRSGIDFVVDGPAGKARAALALRMHGLDAVLGTSRASVATVGRCTIEASSRELRVADPFGDLAVRLRFREGRVGLHRSLVRALAPFGLKLSSGAATVDGEWSGTTTPGADKGWVSARLVGVAGSLAGVPFDAAGRFEARFTQSSIPKGEFHLQSGQVHVSGHGVPPSSREARVPYVLDARIAPGAFFVASPVQTAGNVRVTASSPRGLFSEMVERLGVPRLALAFVHLDSVQAEADWEVSPGFARARLLSASAGNVRANGELLPRDGISRWLLRLGPFAFGIQSAAGETRWVFQDAEGWFQRKAVGTTPGKRALAGRE